MQSCPRSRFGTSSGTLPVGARGRCPSVGATDRQPRVAKPVRYLLDRVRAAPNFTTVAQLRRGASVWPRTAYKQQTEVVRRAGILVRNGIECSARDAPSYSMHSEHRSHSRTERPETVPSVPTPALRSTAPASAAATAQG